MRVWVEGYGCSLSLAEADMIKGALVSKGMELAIAVDEAEVAIVHSCAVKEVTENRMRNRVKKLSDSLSRHNGRVIVSGCLPGANRGALEGLGANVEIAGVGLDAIAKALGFESPDFSPNVPSVSQRGPIAILPVSRGCLSSCAFCATRLARGRLLSYSIEELARRFEGEIASGQREIWLTATDLGCFGMDRGKNLCDLVEALLEQSGDFRIRLGMMSPQYVNRFFDRFVRLFDDPRLYRFLHLPVQSGSDVVLNRMRRAYSANYFCDLVSRLRNSLGDFSLATDIIVGFPGETEADFEASWALVEKTRPSVLNLSRFGARPGTLAAKMDGQLHGREKKERSRAFSKRFSLFAKKNNEAWVGRQLNVLVSEKKPNGALIGRSPSYQPVVCEGVELGSFVAVEVTGASWSFLRAVPAQRVVSVPGGAKGQRVGF